MLEGWGSCRSQTLRAREEFYLALETQVTKCQKSMVNAMNSKGGQRK